MKRTKALELSIKLNNENNGGKGNIVHLDDRDGDGSKFWEILKGTEANIPDQEEPEEEEEVFILSRKITRDKISSLIFRKKNKTGCTELVS